MTSKEEEKSAANLGSQKGAGPAGDQPKKSRKERMEEEKRREEERELEEQRKKEEDDRRIALEQERLEAFR